MIGWQMCGYVGTSWDGIKESRHWAIKQVGCKCKPGGLDIEVVEAHYLLLDDVPVVEKTT